MADEESIILQFGSPDIEKFSLDGIAISAGPVGIIWPTSFTVPAVVVPREYELVLRQDGHDIKIIRRRRVDG